MNKPEAYNRTEILNSSVMTDEISPIMIGDLQDTENQTDDNSAISIDKTKSATIGSRNEITPQQESLPDMEELKKLL